MGKLKKTVKVQEIPGEPLRYRVESWQDPRLFHVVDLIALDGNSQCDCRDFSITCGPNYKANGGQIVEYGYPGSPDPLRTRCRHCTVAIRKFTNALLRRMAADEKARETTPRHSSPFGGNRVAPDKP